MPDDQRKPSFPEYFMGIALAVRSRANCLGNRVGALITVDKRIVSTGYNGTPYNMPECTDGGCLRCRSRSEYPAGTGYDLCICVHAEQNALLAAARFGISVQGGVIYTTLRPCFGCTKELLQAKITSVVFLHDWQHPDEKTRAEYERLQARFPDGIVHLPFEDPEKKWALSAHRDTEKFSVQGTGHTIE